MRECRVGAPRADTALATLRTAGFDPTTPAARALTVVPDTTAPATDTDTATDSAGIVRADRPAPAQPAHAPEARAERGQRPAARHPDTATADTAGAVDVPAPPVPAPAQIPAEIPAGAGPEVLVTKVAETPARTGRVPRWPLLLIAAGAFVAIWGGWVGLGELTGFGTVRLLPGIADWVVLDTAITLPIGVEAYAAFALRAWLAPATAGLTRTARRFACVSALGALVLGAAGQVAYHLMTAAGMTQAPWQITAFVSCLPVVVLGCGAALTHLIHQPTQPGTDAR